MRRTQRPTGGLSRQEKKYFTTYSTDSDDESLSASWPDRSEQSRPTRARNKTLIQQTQDYKFCKEFQTAKPSEVHQRETAMFFDI